jgi:hypothetical protein
VKGAITKSTQTITVHVPMSFTIRGGRKTVISEAVQPPPQPRVDNALLKGLARAHCWRRMIEDGHYASITELAKAKGMNESYACRLLRLTLLAPAIVTEILDGRRAEITLKLLSRPFPSRWDAQAAEFKARQPNRRTSIEQGL